MKRAYVGIRDQPHYRRDAFVSGLKAVGYDVKLGTPQTFDAETVYCCWNRYGPNDDICTRLEKAGGVALIAENGYLAEGGQSPHSMNPRTVYALARHDHNGRGWIPEGGPERWAALGVDLKPWRPAGKHILVAPNRSFGRPETMMPINWAADVVKRLEKLTTREIRIRPHPGNSPPKKPLAEDLAGAWAVVQWSSSAGVHALVSGIPVFVESPFWIMNGCNAGADIEHPLMPDRLPHFQRMAWGQWCIDEISSGEAFRCLLTPQMVGA